MVVEVFVDLSNDIVLGLYKKISAKLYNNALTSSYPMGLKILVVDDATFVRDMEKKAMRDYFHGCEVYEANDGKKAQRLISTTNFDLILSDWEMPELDGAELLRWVRKKDESLAISTPFIMVSSRGDKEHVIQAIQAGVSDYLGKPFTHDELIQKCYKVLSKAGKLPKRGANASTESSTAAPFSFGADILTANTSQTAKTKKNAKPKISNSSGSADALLANTESQKTVDNHKAQLKRNKRPLGVAEIRFDDHSAKSAIESLNLKELKALIKNKDTKPVILAQAVVDIMNDNDTGKNISHLNGYVHALSAVEARHDSELLHITIRFVDKDQEKMSSLSKFIENLG